MESIMKIIAHIYTDFPEKFGIPRQSGLVEELTGRIVFEPEYRNPDAVRGLKGYEYIWLLWKFQDTERAGWSATVKPPRLGGNKRMGVFATRSPFRPNPIGLSAVKLQAVEQTQEGPVLHVAGIDMRNCTPIVDIKPYLPYADAHPAAKGGWAQEIEACPLEVVFPKELLKKLPEAKQKGIIEVLKQDPRPSYQDDPSRRYGVAYDRYDVRFVVKGNVLTVLEVVERSGMV